MEPHRNDANGHSVVGYETKSNKYIIAIGVLNKYSEQLEISEGVFNLYRAAHQQDKPMRNLRGMLCTELLELSEIVIWFESTYRYLVIDQIINDLS